MGNTQKLGNYVNAIFQDASNNVGIGAAPSGSYKLEVTGTAKVSGILTLGSTISNGTYAYTLPSATGTLALTSALGDYLPLAGGTLTGALGGTSATFSSSVTAGSLIVNQASTAADIILKFQINGTNKWLVGLTNDVVDDNFTIYQDGAGGGNRFTINTSGNVGIGTNSPLGSAAERTLHLSDGGGGYATVYVTNSSNSVRSIFGMQSSQNLGIVGTQTNTPFAFYTNDTERMRITSSGSLCINATSPGTLSPYLYSYNGDGSRINAAFEVSIATPGFTAIQFRNPNGAVGSIAINETTVTYGGTSDYRLKEDLKDFNGLDKVNAIKVYDFKWKASEERNEGVLAHELMSVIPYAVNGEKDDVYEDGNIKSQMVDYSKIVPVLVKAIQELNERLNKAGL